MAITPLAALHRKLFDETDGVKFATLKDRLIEKHGETDRLAVLDILSAYARDGQLLHWRTSLVHTMADLIQAQELQEFFSWAVTMPQLAYWGIDGLLKSQGKDAYETVVALALSDSQPLQVRAKAVKSLAVLSRQPFDAGLSAVPDYWKAESLPLDDVLAWQRDGYPDGAGFAPPATHASLEDPRSPLEKAAAKLEKKLAAERKKDQDLARPSNWLVIADNADLAAIDQRWALPEQYRRFLARYSPLRVYIDSKRYFQGLNLYGAAELLKAQHGYSYNPVDQEVIAGWPAHYVVIADAGADPYCLDLSAIENGDAPVYTAEHGAGAWHFERHADSFIDFLKEIAKAA
ncbi:SMI1 / KNR4 family (SUKH-1) [Janthinobacterium lividum]|uniref:SMI1 / KNR4 family (SUKH-1) n=1 Tax=Janthinobacterium lividum TaxID=29581 RepID=A0AB38C4Y3_9BURK|nr:SMI1/KNR4 family protein [Janthinobacterium lividum]SFX29053.1 SMI1 / KNR4 family (SUKH-1) [Janthinobacterium lividum]